MSHEYQSRNVYGLPETLDEPYRANLKPKLHKPKPLDPEERHMTNLKKFAKLFNIHRGGTWYKEMEEPKLTEDSEITLDNGKLRLYERIKRSGLVRYKSTQIQSHGITLIVFIVFINEAHN